ncbi:hypothetical protein VIBNISFn118_1370011 [Vibrio nigripulchritudo SFn118]|nr:hypothetical protein VIBNISFn118_1370011 [Vibrio nigripulchritudo SFn118]
MLPLFSSAQSKFMPNFVGYLPNEIVRKMDNLKYVTLLYLLISLRIIAPIF